MKLKALLHENFENSVFITFPAIIFWLITIAFVFFPVPSAQIFLIVLLSFLSVFVAIIVLRSQTPYLILSPLFFLGTFALISYCCLPHIFVFIETFHEPPTYDITRTNSWIGSKGEMIVIQFVAFCFAINGVVTKLIFSRKQFLKLEGNYNNFRSLFFGTLAILTFIFFLSVLRSFSPAFDQQFSVGIGRQVAFSLEPLISICFAIMAFLAAQKRGPYLLILVLIIFIFLMIHITDVQVVEGKLVYNTVQMPLLICIFALIFYGVLGFKSLRQSIPVLTLIFVVLIFTFTCIGIFRYAKPDLPNAKTASFIEKVKGGILGKLFHRQLNSAYCLNVVINTHGKKTSGAPFYFLMSVVPRVLWSNKPNLSRGYEMHQFCWPKEQNTYSELLTILAEPVYEAGLFGLVIAQGFLAITLSCLFIFLMNGAPIRLMVLGALLPYLAHFQQHFALYLANSLKMFLFMLPVILILIIAQQRSKISP